MIGWLFGIIGGMIAGGIIGFVARGLVPGKQDISVGWTVGLGIAGMWIGQILGRLLPFNNEGVPWIMGTVGAILLLVGLIKTGYLNKIAK